MAELPQREAWLAVGDPALADRWRAALSAQRLAIAPVGTGSPALAVADLPGLQALGIHPARPWTIGVAADPGSALALISQGADDVCVDPEPAGIALRLEVALRTAALRPSATSRELARLTSLMRAVGRASLRLRDRRELLETTCTLALAHGFRSAMVLQLEPDRRILKRIAGAGTPLGEERALDVGLRALGSARPSTADLVDAATQGAPDLVALPLRRAQKATGVLILHGEPETLAPPYRAFLEDLAAALSLALELIDEEARRRASMGALAEQAQREAALAHFGARALQVADVDTLMGELTELVAQTVGADLCRLMRAEADGSSLQPMAAHGLSLGGVELRGGSPAGRALAHGQVVLVDSYAEEQRFAGSGLERAGAVAGLHVVVPLPQGPWGVLELGHRSHRRFSDEQVHFVQTCAALLGHVLARSEAIAAVQRSEATFRALMDALPVGVSVVAADDRMLYANESMARMVGCAREALLSVRASDLIAASELSAARERFSQTVRSRIPNPPRLLQLRRADGSLALVESVTLGMDFDGQPAAVGIGVDVSERQALRETLVRAERLAAVGTLAAGVAHEINNPMAYVIGNLSYLEQELKQLEESLPAGGPERERAAALSQALAEAAEGAARVRQIVGDLKTFSRTDEEQRGPVDVNALVDSSVKIAQAEIRRRAKLVRVRGELPGVVASPGRLGQLFLNLLVNAAQAIPEGQPNMEVRVTTFTDPHGRAVIEVADTGVGIPPELRQRIFDPFFTTKPVGVGTGLGLSICHGIISRLGGELSVESEPGKGSCFRVVLPPGEAAEQARAPLAAPGQQAGTRILVVDDEPLVGAIIQRALAPPHVVERELSAEAALRRLSEGAPVGLILCDLQMPGMSGMELHARLSERDPALAERMVFLSGGAFTPQAQAFLENTDHLCLEKPFDLDTLREAVRERLEQLPAVAP